MSTAAETGPSPAEPEDVARGERFYQQLLDEETREVPVSLRATSAGHLDPAGIVASRYFDPEFHRREVERVWGRTWQMACREEQIPQVGDSIVYEIADWSLIVVRTAPRRDPGVPQLVPPPRDAAADAAGPGHRLPLPLPRVHLEPRRHTPRDPLCLGLPAGRRGLVLPSAGSGRHLGRLRVRERRRAGRAPRGLPRGPAVALRASGRSRIATSRPTSCGRCRATGRWRSRRSSRRTTRWRCIRSCSPRPPTR